MIKGKGLFKYSVVVEASRIRALKSFSNIFSKPVNFLYPFHFSYYMNRRDFLKGVGTAGVVVPAVSFAADIAEAASRAYSKPDQLDTAAKARKLVDYVVSKRNVPGTSEHFLGDDRFNPELVIVDIENKKSSYTVGIVRSEGRYDSLTVNVGASGNRVCRLVMLDDNIGDGKIDKCYIGMWESALLPAEIHFLRLMFGCSQSTTVTPLPSIDLSKINESVELSQKLYEHTLDTLMGVYEKQ